MMRARHLPGLLALVALALPASGEIVVLDFEEGAAVDFRTEPYTEDGARAEVKAGHYEILTDASAPTGNDRALNIDEEAYGLSRIILTVDGGRLFDLVSLDVVNPASSTGEYSFSAIGGGGGSVAAPTTAGPLAFGPGFQGIAALVITQNAPGVLTVDDMTLNVLPEPAMLPTLAALSLAVWGLARRRSA